MSSSGLTIAIAGAGDVAKYVVEEIEATNKHKIVLLSRAERPWFSTRALVELRKTDYTLESLVPLLQDVDVLFSFIHDNTQFFVDVHVALLEACKQSPRCKRFIPSDYTGDIELHPDKPRFQLDTHIPLRKILEAQSEIEFTFVNNGWFADYWVVEEDKRYMKTLIPVWPVDVKKGVAIIPGTGSELITWTSARDVAKALLKLAESPEKWEPHTYLSGETSTWNKALEKYQALTKTHLSISYRSIESINEAIVTHKNSADPTQLWHAYMDEWNYTGASAVPQHIVELQRKKYFKDIHFRKIEDLLSDAVKYGKI
eukprot:TRINITY_DN7080_c1_g1_i1.p1 TRINITY_DN7080_c1_g1~~TRINITY_DN7080_c1_g1_i1.p1  ORF type:complete len:314 (-),score=61.38 TRINITY_DN7080_c1_g1_i1:26-967(-)